ncbi:MAG: RHS repeat-associated core domain-containing protein [Ruminococcaceae bacterium]|nr:RHS repeat-associated core domain-containing protein [Oscillospiraceae bacterium]
MVEYTYDAWGKLLNTVDNSGINLGTMNPLRYRGYYYDQETGLYYLQSRYYDPTVGRFINADDVAFLGANGTVISHNLFSFCVNNPINFTDDSGCVGSPIQWICAAIGGVAGWYFGDYVARSIGLYPGKWWQWRTYAYWAVRALVVAGSSIAGYVAGSALIKIAARYLTKNPNNIFKISSKLGFTKFRTAMKFLKLNPFNFVSDAARFIELARKFNNKAIILSHDWAVKLLQVAKNFGYSILLHSPHKGYSWHLHIVGKNGKIARLHIQIAKKTWDYISKLL